MTYRRFLFGSTCCEIAVGPFNCADTRAIAWALRVEVDGRLTPIFDLNGHLLYGTFRSADEATEAMKRVLTTRFGREVWGPGSAG